MSLVHLQAKANLIQQAISRLKLIIEESEDAFIDSVGIKDAGLKKKAKGYYDYILEDKAKLAMLEQLETRYKSWIKQQEAELADKTLKVKANV